MCEKFHSLLPGDLLMSSSAEVSGTTGNVLRESEMPNEFLDILDPNDDQNHILQGLGTADVLAFSHFSHIALFLLTKFHTKLF